MPEFRHACWRMRLFDSNGQPAAESRIIASEPKTLPVIIRTVAPKPAATIQLVSALAATFYEYDTILYTVSGDAASDLPRVLEFLQFTRDDTIWKFTFPGRSFQRWIAVLVVPPAVLTPLNPMGGVRSAVDSCGRWH